METNLPTPMTSRVYVSMLIYQRVIQFQGTQFRPIPMFQAQINSSIFEGTKWEPHSVLYGVESDSSVSILARHILWVHV